MSHAHELYRVYSNGTEIDSTKSHAAAVATLDSSVGASVILYGQRLDGKLEPLLEKRNGFRIDPTDLPKRNSRRPSVNVDTLHEKNIKKFLGAAD